MNDRVPYVAAPRFDTEHPRTLQWHAIECQLVTPLYGGGVEKQTVDMAMPVRVSAIRGQLRFWWRLLAKHKWQLGNPEAIRREEFALWGGMSNESGAGASQVLLKVHQFQINGGSLINRDDKDIKALFYVLFPLRDKKDKDNSIQLLKAGSLQFRLDIAFLPKLQRNETHQQRVIETLKWWANFGGLGARTRRGLGAVYVKRCDSFPQICQTLKPIDVAKAGCQLKIRTEESVSALKQLKWGIEKLANFRQAIGVGRRGTPQKAGRSFWPEADALRRIKQFDKKHQPEHKAGNVFPRAMFGLPILFFSKTEPSLNRTVEPVAAGDNYDRLASPLIIRPYYKWTRNGQKLWSVAALVMPYQHIIEKMSVSIKDRKAVSIEDRKSYPVWTPDAAQHIKPIRDNQGTDPLTAFLNYFPKENS